MTHPITKGGEADFARAIGYPPGHPYQVDQRHGSSVQVVVPGMDFGAVRRSVADALVTQGSGIAIGVRTADCVPLLLADTRSGAVAAIHAGWRGVVAGVVEAGWHALQAHGRGSTRSTPQEGTQDSPERSLHAARDAEDGVVAAIFPHIRGCCFEVGEDVAAALRSASADLGVVDRTRPKPHVDLSAVVRAKLLHLGLRPERLDDVPGCTYCDAERFFSFRRQGQHAGRHVSVIVSA